MRVKEKFPTVADILASPIAKFINIAINYCRYGGTEEYLIVNYVHPLFLKAKVEESIEENQNWRKATTGLFANAYWKTTRLENLTL